MTPKISVIIPVYNREHFLSQAIESVLAQSFQDFELLVVDDGSNDRSPDIIKEYCARFPEKVKYLEHPQHKNHGVSATRNAGIRVASGKYIAFLDSDDLWFPEKLQRQIEILEQRQEIGLIYCPLRFIDENGQPTQNTRVQDINDGRPSATMTEAFDLFFARAVSFGFSAVAVRADMACKVGWFDAGLDYQYEDAIFVTKMAYLAPVYFLSEPLAMYRIHNRNASWEAIEQKGGKNINYAIMRRVQQWLEQVSGECQTPPFRVRLADLSYDAYHQNRISRWGFYKLLILLFPYQHTNVSLLKIFFTLFCGHQVTSAIQKYLNVLHNRSTGIKR